MRGKHQYLAALAAAALLLAGCDRGGGSSGAGGSSGSPGQAEAWRTGLFLRTEAEEEETAGEIHMVAAAVLLDGEGRIAQVALDELEARVEAGEDGTVTVPDDLRTKRQKGDDYPLDAVSSIGKSWAEQADAFGAYLTGMTADEVRKLETDADGYPKDADLLSGCTIRVEDYREAVAAACLRAEAAGAAEGDRLALGVEAADASAPNLKATEGRDAAPQLDLTAAALTVNGEGRVTGAVCDMAEPSLTVDAAGKVTAPDGIRSKNELGDEYGMREASALGKEWYEQSEGFAGYLKGKTAGQIAGIPDDGSDEDLAALCTISITDLQRAALRALDSLGE